MSCLFSICISNYLCVLFSTNCSLILLGLNDHPTDQGHDDHAGNSHDNDDHDHADNADNDDFEDVRGLMCCRWL